jgi:hypothetical protein
LFDILDCNRFLYKGFWVFVSFLIGQVRFWRLREEPIIAAVARGQQEGLQYSRVNSVREDPQV